MARVPLGVIILAVLNFLTGLLLLVGSFPLFNQFSSWILIGILQSIPYGLLIIALIYILLGFGLFTLAKWAWYTDIIFAIVNLIIILLDVLGSGGPLNIANIAWVPLILNLIIVLYLNQGSIRRKFSV